MSGLNRAYSRTIAEAPFIKPIKYLRTLLPPHRYYQYIEYDKDDSQTNLLDRVHELISIAPTYKVFGYTFKDLIQLPYSEFVKVEEQVVEYMKEKLKSYEDSTRKNKNKTKGSSKTVNGLGDLEDLLS
jgi:hypothetical protein